MHHFALPCVALAAVLWCMPTYGATWIEQAVSELTCTALADTAERAQLDSPFLPDARNARAVETYFRAAPKDNRHARFRHLTILAAIAWWADLINDQMLRANVQLTIATLSERYSAEGDDTLFRQVARCAHVQIISAALEQGVPEVADRVAGNLVRLYPNEMPVQRVQDWPLILALRELRLEPASRSAIARLATRAAEYAAAAARAGDAARASRLLAATAQALLALGQPDEARKVALQSLAVTGKPPADDAAWRALPTLYDVTLAVNGPADAANLTALVRSPTPPPGFSDHHLAFETLLRLSKAAETKGDYSAMGRYAADAFGILSASRGLERLSMPFYRSALNQLAETRDEDALGELARRDSGFAAKTYSTYVGLYDTLVKQAQSQYVADAREQLFFQHKIDNSLRALSELTPALPRAQSDTADITFRLAQLRSFGRLTLATLAAELDRANIDPQFRFNVERFFTLSTQTAVWLRRLWATVMSADGVQAPDGAALWRAFFTLDVFYQETSKEYERYLAFVRQKAPGVAELATPRPLPAADFQQLLGSDEAIVATLVTPLDLYVWAVTRSGVTFSQARITERELGEKVQRLRAGLIPGSAGGTTSLPPFDAATAHELYRLVFEPLTAALQGVTHVIWYGHGALGAVPPSVLVAAQPPSPVLRTPEDFAATKFLVDQYAVSALADLSLFPWHRRSVKPTVHPRPFLGVGAPLLAASELAGTASRSRSYELAGGLSGKELSQLPKLAESVDELKALAAILGVQGSTLWLGPEASERHFVSDGLSGYQVIALATHGFLPGEVRNVPEPALMLALSPDSQDRFDGILTSQEIARLKLDADFVILSACNTATADGRPRAETFTGLTQAFFTAGAKSLMVSHWPVMSGAAVQLSVGTVERARKEGQPLAQSLQRAIQAVRKASGSNAIEAHPSYWGPFVIVGDGRRSLQP